MPCSSFSGCARPPSQQKTAAGRPLAASGNNSLPFPAQQPHRVERHQHGRPGIGQNRRPQAGDAADGGDEEHAPSARAPRRCSGRMLPHRTPSTGRSYSATSPTRPWRIGGVGGFERHVGAAAHGDADIGRGEGRGVVDAVADLGDHTALRPAVRARCAACPPAGEPARTSMPRSRADGARPCARCRRSSITVLMPSACEPGQCLARRRPAASSRMAKRPATCVAGDQHRDGLAGIVEARRSGASVSGDSTPHPRAADGEASSSFGRRPAR